MVKSTTGFTLIELMVVIAVLGVVGTMVFFGIQSFDQGQAVLDAQRNLLVSLRTLQNKVNSGADGESVKRVDLVAGGSSYNLQTVGDETLTVNLPANTTLTYSASDGSPLGSPLSLCFVNPNLAAFDGTHVCGLPSANPCISGSGYVCDRSGVPQALSPPAVRVTLTRGDISKTVVIEGSGMTVTRMYAQ